jgi:hypothetical protein
MTITETQALTQIVSVANDVTTAANTVRISVPLNNIDVINAAAETLSNKIATLEIAVNLLDKASTYQLFSTNNSSGSVYLNGTVILSGIQQLKSIALSADGQILYVVSHFTMIRAYKVDLLTGVWSIYETFNYKASENSYPGGLFLLGNVLFITNNSRNSINAVDAKSGSPLVNKETGIINAEIANGFDVPTSMVSDGKYIYVANTGKRNSGSTVSRMNLDGSDLILNWVKDLEGPTQMVILGGYLYVVNGPFNQSNNIITQIDLASGTIIGPLAKSDKGEDLSFTGEIGLVVLKKQLNVIDNL